MYADIDFEGFHEALSKEIEAVRGFEKKAAAFID
jgi:hypothetical protein